MFLCVVAGRVNVVGDQLASSWVDSYLHADVDVPAAHTASDWPAEFAMSHRRQPPTQVVPAEQFWARDFLSQHEHDVWSV